MATVAARWSITLGHPVTPAQVVLCMIDLKLTRLNHNSKRQDSVCDLAGYAAILQEVNGQPVTSPAQKFFRRLRYRLFGSTRQLWGAQPMSGQLAHSMNVSPGFNACSASAVSADVKTSQNHGSKRARA